MKLTDATIRSLPTPEKGQKTYFDDIIPSFGCRVSQGGSRSFIVMLGLDRQRTTIGKFPVISLAEARAEAKRILAEHTLGKHRPKTIKWDDAVELYLEACKEKNKQRTVDDYTRLLALHFPFGSQNLAEKTYEDIERRLKKIRAPSEKNHALVAVKIFLGWCQKPPRRFIPTNPCEGMSPTKRPGRKRVLSEIELPQVLRTALEGQDNFSRIVSLLVLTGQRRSEIGHLQWPWINQRERLITLPETITKNKLEHTFPYGDMAADVIEAIPRLNSTDYLFPPSRDHVRGKPTVCFNGWATCKPKFDEKVPIAHWRLHDLRRTFRSLHGKIGTPKEIAERIINHAAGVTTEVERIYDQHKYIEEMHVAMQNYEAHISQLLAA